MIDAIEFLDVLLSGLALIGMAVAIGGVAFSALVLREAALFPSTVHQRSLRIVVAGSLVLAGARLLALLLVPLTLGDGMSLRSLGELCATAYARATLIQIAAGLTLAWLALSAKNSARLRCSSMLMALAAVVVLASGAWLTHAASRVDGAATLMAVTTLHQFGAAVWVGGIVQLALLSRIARRGPGNAWPRLLARFSPMALASVVLLLGASLYLAWVYVGDWDGLFGTGYGAMALAKLALLAMALGLGAANYLSVRRWRSAKEKGPIAERVTPCVEAELAVVITALLTAASLTSQPPAVDVRNERATGAEVLAFLAPKKPVLTQPPREVFLANAAPTTDIFAVPGPIEHRQNNFNHNVAGLLVFGTGVAAALDRGGLIGAARHWPLLFLLLAAFMFVFAEPTIWPAGTESFWNTLLVPAVLQHRLATALVVGLAVVEWRVRTGRLRGTRWRFVFPILCVAGGAMLLTHSHTVFATKSEFLIEFSHALLGLIAVMIGIARWLELRLRSRRAERAAGMLWTMGLVAAGLVLLFYREA